MGLYRRYIYGPNIKTFAKVKIEQAQNTLYATTQKKLKLNRPYKKKITQP